MISSATSKLSQQGPTTHGLGVAEIPEGAAGDGVEPELVRLAVLVDAVGDDANGLPFACCIYTAYIQANFYLIYLCSLINNAAISKLIK